jgi:serine/threonine protein kinase
MQFGCGVSTNHGDEPSDDGGGTSQGSAATDARLPSQRSLDVPEAQHRHALDATRTANGAIEPPATTRLPAPLVVRDRGRYLFLGEHGRGGLGRVFRARDREIGRDVAIKELLNRSPAAELRFFREAIITARLEHPGIVAVHEAGQWTDGTPFYAMKLVAGRPLSALLVAERNERTRPQMVRHLAAVADAIAYAHEQRIIHRDLKPSNIIVGDFGETVVIDWGLAKDLTMHADDEAADVSKREPSSAELTVAGAVLGTPAYMAPEQARGEQVDERADVYGLGAILREICSHPRNGGIDADNDLQAIIGRATTPERRNRYATARELAHDLHAYLDGRRVSAREYSLGAAIAHWIRHHRTIAAIATFSVVAMSVVAAVAVARVVHARSRAEQERAGALVARDEARRDRADALLAQASLLSQRDPTAAWRILAGHELLGESKLLASRLQASGVARSTVKLSPQGFLAMALYDNDEQLAIVNYDRMLRIYDLRSGTWRIADHDLTNPSPLAARGSRVAYLKRTNDGFELTVLDATTAPKVVARLTADPWGIGLGSDSVYWRDERHTLWSASLDDGTIHRVAANIEAFDALDYTVVACTEHGKLVVLRPDGKPARAAPLTRCDPQGAVMVSGEKVLVQVEGALAVIEGSEVTRLPIDLNGPTVRYSVARSGVVVAIDGQGRGMFRAVDSGEFDSLAFGSSPVVATANADVVAWGFSDGRVVAIDTSTRDTWNLIAHPEGVEFLLLAPDGRTLLSTGSDELRTWA